MKQNNGMTAHQSRHSLLTADFLIPLLLLSAGTLLFQRSGLDLAIQSHFYRAGGEWAFNNPPWAKLIYHYGNLPALLLSLGALVVFILGFSRPKALPYRKISLFLVLSMLLGPGIIANSLLKEYWGRPRPRELIQFGGEYRYEAPLTIDPSSPGKSFPCGHATMGFYIFALGLVLRQRRRVLSAFVMLGALGWGTIIGWVRIGMGGHFASDVLWAAGVVYFTSYLLFHALKLDKSLFYVPQTQHLQRKLSLAQKVLLYGVGLLIVIGVLLATPYAEKSSYPIGSRVQNADSLSLSLQFQTADLEVINGSQTLFSYENNGFGFPGSKLKNTSEYQQRGFAFTQWKKGFFTELGCNADLTITPGRVRNLSIVIDEGKLSLPANISDTLFVSERTKFQPGKAKPVILVSDKPEQGFWVDVPLLELK